MNRHIILINDRIFIFAFKGNNLSILKLEDKFKQIDFKDPFTKTEDIENTTIGLIQITKKQVLKSFKNGQLKTTEELKKEFDKILDGINIKGLNTKIDFKSHTEYQKALKELSDELNKQTENNLKQKQEIIEESLDVDLKELFKQHGITEYEISPNKSVITYEKDGIPHILTHTDPNSNIYEVVLRSLDFDKLNSKEQLDDEIERIFNIEKDYRYTNHQTTTTDNIEDKKIDDIAEFLRRNYGINKLYDVKPAPNDTLGETLIADFGEGWQTLFIKRNGKGVITEIDFGREKELDNDKNTNLAKQSIKTEAIEEELSDVAQDSQISEIKEKLENEYDLTDEEINVILSYKEDENKFYSLPIETQQELLVIIELFEAKYPEYSSKKENGRQYKIEPINNSTNAFVEIGIVTFLSTLISGLFVFTFFKMFM